MPGALDAEEGGREGGKEGGTEGWREADPGSHCGKTRPPPGQRCWTELGSGVHSLEPQPALAQAGGKGCMAARRLLLHTMKQICLCAAASFAVRPCPPSPVPFGPVLRGKPCDPHPTWTPCVPNPIAGLGYVLSNLLCPCMTRVVGGNGHHPPSLPSNPGRLVYSPDGVLWPRRAGGACRGTRQAQRYGPHAWHRAPG